MVPAIALALVALAHGCAISHEAACTEAVEGPAKVWLYTESTEGCGVSWRESTTTHRCATVVEACGTVYADCDELEVTVSPDGRTEALYSYGGVRCEFTGARIELVERP